jgi:hypothetical protein
MSSILRSRSQSFLANFSTIEYGAISNDAYNHLQGMLLLTANNTGLSIDTYWGARTIIIILLRGIPSSAVWTNVDCYLNRTNPNWVPPFMPSDLTLKEWTPVVYGSLMNLDPHGIRIGSSTKIGRNHDGVW